MPKLHKAYNPVYTCFFYQFHFFMKGLLFPI